MTAYRRGDVVPAVVPFADLTGSKRRPVLIVQDERVPSEFGNHVVVAITSKRRSGPNRVEVEMGTPEYQEMGLLTPSVIMGDFVATVNEKAFSRRLGRCDRLMPEIERAVRTTLRL